jgi:predicted DNA-binding transcriptional regulator YafY
LSPISASEREALSRPQAFLGSSESEMVTIVFDHRARFAVEGLVNGALYDLDGGRVTATIPVSDTEGFLGRLLLLLGPDAVLIDPPELADAGKRAARRALARYGA